MLILVGLACMANRGPVGGAGGAGGRAGTVTGVQAREGAVVQTPDHEVILDHARHPRRAGLREPFDVEVVRTNPTCGDRVTLRLLVRDGRIEDASHEGLGCTVSTASASVVTDLVVGRTPAEARELGERFGQLLGGGAGAGAVIGAGVVGGRGTDRPWDPLGEAVAFRVVAGNPVRRRCALLAWTALAEALDRAASLHP